MHEQFVEVINPVDQSHFMARVDAIQDNLLLMKLFTIFCVRLKIYAGTFVMNFDSLITRQSVHPAEYHGLMGQRYQF